MTTLSETDAAVQDDASVADVVSIPWHYLGATECLTRGTKAPILHYSLLSLPPDNVKVRTALKADQRDPNSTIDGLLDRVLDIARTSWFSKPVYTWALNAWPDNFPIRIRAAHPDIFLSKDGFVLPWPWDEPDGPLKARREAAFDEHADTIGDTLTTSGGLRLTAFMRAADDAVTVKWPVFRDQMKGGMSPKQWIVDRAVSEYEYAGPAYPADLIVTPDSSRVPTATAWEINRLSMSGQMTLKLGTMGLPTTGIKIDEPFIMHKWPCGAFAGQ